MGKQILIINKDYQYTAWMEVQDAIDYINANTGNKITILDPLMLDDLDEFTRWLRQLLAWDKEG